MLFFTRDWFQRVTLLTPYIVRRLNYKCDRDEAEYFLSKSSIHRETQVDILCTLINQDHYLVEEALALIAGLNNIQLKFIRHHERDQLLSLTATQMIILNDRDLSDIHVLVIAANWITTHTQYQLLIAHCVTSDKCIFSLNVEWCLTAIALFKQT